MVEVTLLDFAPEASLKFFTYQSYNDHERGFPPSTMGNIFWISKKVDLPQGPFNNLHDALVHFKSIIETTKPTVIKVAKTDTSNVVYVDFANKKRL